MTRPIGTAEELQRRRERAVEALAEGKTPAEVASVLGVHVNSVHRWRRMNAGPAGLAAVPRVGEPGLSDADLRRLARLLAKGAKHHGWRNELWTASRVAVVIHKHFGIGYHPEHVRKILKRRLGWTSQRPRREPPERDDVEAARWAGDELPRIIREAFRRGAHMAFLDESGFQTNPSVRRTFAPRGRTPTLDAPDCRDRISAISCVTLSPVMARPGLYFRLLPTNRTVKAPEVVAFLEDLRRQLRGPFTVVWDGNGIHSKARLVKEWLARHPEVVAETLPPYCPKMNPDEWVWSWAKYGQLANLAAYDADELRWSVLEVLVDLKFSPVVLASFFQDTELPLAA
jgi:transposase